MKANELRIGNFVLYQEYYIATVHGITDPDYGNGIHVHYDNVCIGCEHGLISGIPLTEEWLRKFGFDIGYHKTETSTQKFYSKLWGTNGVEILVEDYHYKGFEYQLAKSKYIFLEYVHQLQNLYFALTGNELTIKEEQQ